MIAQRHYSRGFTLVELAIVLIILALLSGGLMMTLSSQVDQRSYRETQQQLQDIRDALLGYAASHPALDGKPYLPCPDTDGDGIENRTGNLCASAGGQFPWVTVGFGNQDAWSNRFRYVDELKRMGAQIQVDGKVAVIEGIDHFVGAPIQACDLRAGAALVIAALAAHGTTEVSCVQYIERG